MTTPHPFQPQGAPESQRQRCTLATIGAVALIAIALFLSRSVLTDDSAVVLGAAPQDKDATPAAKAVQAAKAFLASLEDKQRDKAVFAFKSPKRAGWSNLPVTMVPRNGVRMGDLTKEQRGLAMHTLAAVLSKEGYQKVVDIVDGDQQLAEGKGGGKGPKGDKGGKGKGGKGGKAMFGADQYFLAFFGKPSVTEPWLIQFGGHHLGVNVTVVGKDLVLTPTHTGAQPTSFIRGGKEVRPLGLENDAAFKLINLLDEKQQAQAMLKDGVTNLQVGPGRDGVKLQPGGIKGSAMTEPQRAVLLELIGAWINMLSGDAARARMAEIKSKLDDTYFGWNGSTTNGKSAYYRIVGPSVEIEYAPQAGVNHIHTVIRDPNNDYGAALVKR